MPIKDITNCRGTLDFLQDQGELLAIEGEVNPVLEVSGITKALDNGPALLFKNVKGYPGCRILANLFSRGDRLAKIFDAADIRGLRLRGIEAFKKPAPSKIVDGGACQEVVITRDIDVLKTLPIIKHTETDPGRILGGGIALITGPDIGSCISYKRIHFRGSDWASLAFNLGSHFEYWVLERRKNNEHLPLTVNICPAPAVMAVAGGGSIPIAVPAGSDELAIVGAIQGAPVEICKAKTVDAYAIANAEWVIEGYIDTSQVVWESEEAEKKKDFSTPFFPEYHGHQGRAQSTYKFQATAITFRKEVPIFYAPLAHSFERCYMQVFNNDASLLDLLNRPCPGLVIDVNALPGMKGINGIVIQVHKQRRRDEDHIRNLILTAWAVCSSLRMVVVVDEDVNIYDADEIMWTLTTRVNPRNDLIMMPPSRIVGQADGSARPTAPAWRMGFDATAPLEYKWQYFRGEYPKVELERWLSKQEISRVRAQQSEYAQLIAEKRV